MTTWRPALLLGATALAMVALVFVTSGVASDDTVSRMYLGAGLVLFARDAVVAGFSDNGGRRLSGVRRLVRALHIALFVVALVQILNWGGPDTLAPNMPVALAAGMGAGFCFSFAFVPGSKCMGLAPRFNTDRAATDSLLGRLVYTGFPVVAAFVILMGTYLPPAGGWSGGFPLFQMSFLPFLVPLYPLSGTIVSNLADHLPRALGFGLLITGLITGG